MRKILQKTLNAALLVLASLALPAAAHAATLFLSPNGGSYETGKSFTVGVFVSSPDQAMNGASGRVMFPPDKLQVVSVSKSDSIIRLWATEPSFSNDAGTVDFEGVALNPGYTGRSGNLVSITFKAKNAGTASVSIAAASILANDGLGTNIYQGAGGAAYTVVAASEPQPAVQAHLLPPAPIVASSTHPDESAWYAAKQASFTWQVPAGVTKVRLLIGRRSDAVPTVEYQPPISQKSIPDLEDGVWYFLAQFANAEGWGPVGQRRLRVDSNKPSRFTVTPVPPSDSADRRAAFVFDAADETSGVDHFTVRVDDGTAETWKDDGSHRYVTLELAPGDHVLAATAVDAAGNALEAAPVAFNIVGVTAAVTEEPSGSQPTVGAPVTGAGKVKVIHESAAPAATSSNWAMLAFVIALALLALEFVVALLVKILRLSAARRRVDIGVKRTENILQRAFELLRKDVQERISKFEGSRLQCPLTAEEKKILTAWRQELDDVEEILRKEIEHIK